MARAGVPTTFMHLRLLQSSTVEILVGRSKG